jgi:hypothetical protein
MSSKIVLIIPFTYIPIGVYFQYGASYSAGVSVRKMRAHLGSASGKYRGAEGLPEMQESVLEYTAKERRKGREEMTSETRVFIEVGDVSGIEIECLKCTVKSTFPISSCAKIDGLCPHCEKPWFDKHTDERDKTTYPAVDSIRAIAAELSALNTKRTDIHAKIRIHLNQK